MRISPIGRVTYEEGDRRTIEILPEYEDGLYRIGDNDELLVLYLLDRIDDVRMRTHLRGDPRNLEVGVFSSRSPMRPNHIAATVVRLISVEGNKLLVEGLDAFDGSPVVDIKPARRRDWTAAAPSSPSHHPARRKDIY